MVHIEPIAQSRNASCDLVELYALLAPIWVRLEAGGRYAMGRADLPRFWTYIAAYFVVGNGGNQISSSLLFLRQAAEEKPR